MLPSLAWGAAIRGSSSSPPTLHFQPLLLPFTLPTACFYLCPTDTQTVAPVTTWVHTHHIKREITSLSQ